MRDSLPLYAEYDDHEAGDTALGAGGTCATIIEPDGDREAGDTLPGFMIVVCSEWNLEQMTIGKTHPTLQHYIVEDNKIISFLISDYFVDVHLWSKLSLLFIRNFHFSKFFTIISVFIFSSFLNRL